MDKNIKLLVMDVDGTLTDGKIYIGAEGEVLKCFNIKDGCGIKNILPYNEIIPVIITGRVSKSLEVRAKELGIKELYQGIEDKVGKLQEILQDYKCTFENVAYIGDDINDLECMRECAYTGCPIDAVEEIRQLCQFVSTKKGGEGAVRDFIEWLIKD
ncbi:MAG: HAD hydrolase family protein [Lachnospiraceae bacterium]|nr:HAD hydrolase family protein [Lachnospiraceae bacterium]